MSPKGIVSLNRVRFSYNGAGKQAIQDLSLEIPTSAVTAILGPNGSGKTTLLSILLGLLSPQKGTIHIDGKHRDEYSRSEMSQLMGLVPQEEHFPYGFSVQDYVLLGRAPYLGLLERPGELDRQAARDALETVGMKNLADRLIPSLSGGERQLATLARALAQRPRILLMDEPTSHLDLNNKSHIMSMIRVLAETGVSVIITTHDPNAIAMTADYVVLLRQGHIVATGPMATAFNSTNLSVTYGLPVKVAHVEGHPVVLAL